MRQNHIYYIVAAVAFVITFSLLGVSIGYGSKTVSKIYTLSFAEGNQVFDESNPPF